LVDIQGKKLHLSYAELHSRVEHFAGVLRNFGVEKGDVVLIYLPMIPESAVAMLACARFVPLSMCLGSGFARQVSLPSSLSSPSATSTHLISEYI